MRAIFVRLGEAHDRLTSATFFLAQLCLVAIVFAYSYETIARYFFAAPTWWSNEVVAFALCIGTFLALPQVTREAGHIAITFVIDILPDPTARHVHIALAIASGLVCLLVAWICLKANITHFLRDEMLVRVRPVPKLWLSVWLTYGFLSAGLHFLRQVANPPRPII